ncbi:MAG: lytic transglycosylase domain-containing protein [Pseudomonadota bacterium]
MSRPAALTFDAPRICGLIRTSAERYGLPPAFFARLIWKESRFDIGALSPVGAQGIAQFMPGTAKERGLTNPWDPRQAIPASASFLADLRAEFGNWGLAAAAYNGGPNRVARWLARGSGRLPWETEDYVLSITNRPADWFRQKDREVEKRPLEEGKSFDDACARLPVVPTRAPSAGAPWGVQIAAGITRRAAMRNFSRARARLTSVVGGRSAIVVRSRKVGGRRLYSARVGAPSRVAARKLCARIKRVGGTCVVRRN